MLEQRMEAEPDQDTRLRLSRLRDGCCGGPTGTPAPALLTYLHALALVTRTRWSLERASLSPERARCACSEARSTAAAAPQWHLSITVQTWRSWQGPDGQLLVEQVVDEDDYDEQDEQWWLGSYDVDPTEVEYGPHRLSAERQVLQL